MNYTELNLKKLNKLRKKKQYGRRDYHSSRLFPVSQDHQQQTCFSYIVHLFLSNATGLPIPFYHILYIIMRIFFLRMFPKKSVLGTNITYYYTLPPYTPLHTNPPLVFSNFSYTCLSYHSMLFTFSILVLIFFSLPHVKICFHMFSSKQLDGFFFVVPLSWFNFLYLKCYLLVYLIYAVKTKTQTTPLILCRKI